MRLIPSISAALIILSSLGLAQRAAGQPVAAPTIHRVTLQADSGVLTISGTGLGADLLVTLDGQPVTTLPGATDTELRVQAPRSLFMTPGTYRLTVVDTVRQIGDGFVVASPLGYVDVTRGVAGDVSNAVSTANAPRAIDATALAGPPRPSLAPKSAGASPQVIEDFASANTAIGANALASNTTGLGNTASGAAALGFNTSGNDNTANGAFALRANTVGTLNTGIGASSLRSNTTGSRNTAAGSGALYSNTTGYQNTASGELALFSNTTGIYNTANGAQALHANTTGVLNTATGLEALRANTTGYWNTASGVSALTANTTGIYNTASGVNAMAANTTGSYNTATGVSALPSNTVGVSNVAHGHEALFANTTGGANVAVGVSALRSNTGGGSNTATGLYSLYYNTTGYANTASGESALFANSTGEWNVAIGKNAGFWVTGGRYNVYLGAEVAGTTADTNTMRLGLAYSGGSGQNRTFIAGIHGTQLTAPAVLVYVDANGQLGTLTPSGPPEGWTPGSALQQQVEAQQATILELRQRSREQRATIDDLLARLVRLEEAGARRR